MRINILTGAFIPLPPVGCGAVERVWHGLAPLFAAQGHAVTFYARAHPSQAADETIEGVRFVRQGRFAQTGIRAVNLVKDLLYALRMLRILKPADVFVCNDFCSGLLYPYLGQRGGKLVLNVQRIPKRFLRFYYRKSTRLVAVSEAVRESLGDVAIGLLGKTRVIPNPIYTDIFRPPSAHRDYSGSQTLLYTGRIHPEKGLHVLVDAFARISPEFPHLGLKIVGPSRYEQGGGGAAYMRRLRGASRGLPVEYGEPVTDIHELANLLQNAHFYCYPSLAEHGETFGVAALEAAATGLVPVVSDLKCFREFVQHNQNGIVFDHRDADPGGNLAKALRRMLADQDHLRQMSARAIETAAIFSYPEVAGRYLQLFAELTQSSRVTSSDPRNRMRCAEGR